MALEDFNGWLFVWGKNDKKEEKAGKKGKKADYEQIEEERERPKGLYFSAFWMKAQVDILYGGLQKNDIRERVN